MQRDAQEENDKDTERLNSATSGRDSITSNPGYGPSPKSGQQKRDSRKLFDAYGKQKFNNRR